MFEEVEVKFLVLFEECEQLLEALCVVWVVGNRHLAWLYLSVSKVRNARATRARQLAHGFKEKADEVPFIAV